MRTRHIQYLACPQCHGDLRLQSISKGQNDLVEEGTLQCSGCAAPYDIIEHVPRFVPMENYANGFGFQWNKHAETQLDSKTGTRITAEQFFKVTQWPRGLREEIILEVGGGAGRFTEVAAATGAMVISIDYSIAVDANYRSNGWKDNVLVIQADVYSMPLKSNSFDRIFCFGVLQHTP